jgi:hypothetical protein
LKIQSFECVSRLTILFTHGKFFNDTKSGGANLIPDNFG